MKQYTYIGDSNICFYIAYEHTRICIRTVNGSFETPRIKLRTPVAAVLPACPAPGACAEERSAPFH